MPVLRCQNMIIIIISPKQSHFEQLTNLFPLKSPCTDPKEQQAPTGNLKETRPKSQVKKTSNKNHNLTYGWESGTFEITHILTSAIKTRTVWELEQSSPHHENELNMSKTMESSWGTRQELSNSLPSVYFEINQIPTPVSFRSRRECVAYVASSIAQGSLLPKTTCQF